MTTDNTFASQEELIISQEKATVDAFKNKRKDLFTKNFAKDYIGVANDGVKTAEDEVAGMLELNLDSISVEDEKLSFPAKDTAIMTYTMKVKGTRHGKDISGNIYCSTVFARQEENWLAVLHTESVAQ